MLQDHWPLTACLEWELDQERLRRRGSLAFIGDPDLAPSSSATRAISPINATEDFVTSLVEAEAAGPLGRDEEVFVLGLGFGMPLTYYKPQ